MSHNKINTLDVFHHFTLLQEHSDPEAGFLVMEDESYPETVCFSAKYPVFTVV
jgi:hypothetical protein